MTPSNALLIVSKQPYSIGMPCSWLHLPPRLSQRRPFWEGVTHLSRLYRVYSLVGKGWKKGIHLALDDIRESIEELKFYREKVFTI